MRRLLDTSSQRIIKILETLAEAHDWITLSDLSKIVGASERTLADDISKIRTRWEKQLNMEVSKKKWNSIA